jgi:hypothetical protein
MIIKTFNKILSLGFELFDYLSNWTSNQIEQKIEHLVQNGQWVLLKWDIWSSWRKQNGMFRQNDQWFSCQIEHPMLVNKPN